MILDKASKFQLEAFEKQLHLNFINKKDSSLLYDGLVKRLTSLEQDLRVTRDEYLHENTSETSVIGRYVR